MAHKTYWICCVDHLSLFSILMSAQQYLANIEQLVAGDLNTFQNVLLCQFPNKLGFSMLGTAAAVLDICAFITHQNPPPANQIQNRTLFQNFLADTRFVSPGDFTNHDLIYIATRCGVAHQLFPKGMSIVAISSSILLYQHNNEVFINCFAFYKISLEILSKVIHHVNTATPTDQAIFDNKVQSRLSDDAIAFTQANINISTLPQLPAISTSPGFTTTPAVSAP